MLEMNRKGDCTHTILILTPLQFICALEYILKEGIALSTCCLIVVSRNKNTLKQIENFSEFKEFKMTFTPMVLCSNLSVSIAYTYFCLKKHLYQNLIIGNLDNGWCRYALGKNKNAIIVDDGTKNIPILNSRQRGDIYLPGFKGKDSLSYFFQILNSSIPSLYLGLNFYSMFEYLKGGQNDKVERNNFKFFNAKFADQLCLYQNELWFIGTPLVQLNMINKDDYIKILEEVAIIASKMGLQIKYYKHRVEQIDWHFSFKIIENIEPIEITYLKSIKKPKIICSFYSAALFLLSNFDTKTEIISIPIRPSNRLGDHHIWYGVDQVYAQIKEHAKIKDFSEMYGEIEASNNKII